MQEIRRIQAIAENPDKYGNDRHYEAVYLLGLLRDAKLLAD